MRYGNGYRETLTIRPRDNQAAFDLVIEHHDGSGASMVINHSSVDRVAAMLLQAAGRKVPLELGPGLTVASALERKFGERLRVLGLNWTTGRLVRCGTKSDGQGHFCTPDFLFEQERVAVFVDGCYWHACDLHFPGGREDVRAKDDRITEGLRKNGWNVVRIWEHDDLADGAVRVARLVEPAWTPPHRPQAICGYCDRLIGIRSDGKLRVHRSPLRRGGLSDSNCEGSGLAS